MASRVLIYFGQGSSCLRREAQPCIIKCRWIVGFVYNNYPRDIPLLQGIIEAVKIE